MFMRIFAQILCEREPSGPFFYSLKFIMIEHKIAEWLQERFTQDDLNDCFLVGVKESQSTSKIEVFVDSDSTLTLRKCQLISRYLENLVEENGLVPDKYLLEVSSPGVGNPLILRRQYVKNIGRKIAVKSKTGDTYKGKLTEVKDNDVTIVREASGKGKKKVEEKIYKISFDDIQTAKIKVSF